MSSYIGDNPFLFFSYCHADREEVFRIADAVDKAGYRAHQRKQDIHLVFIQELPSHAPLRHGHEACHEL